MKSLSRVRPSATPWTAAFQAPPSMGFSRQEYWSGVPLPSLDVYTRKNYINRNLYYRLGKYILKKLFIYCSDFIAACRLSLVVVSQSYSVTMRGLLIAVTSLVAEHGL